MIIEQKKKIGIPHSLRSPLIWTIFFIVIGIIIQSIQAGNFVFLDFFGKNFIAWVRNFGYFTNTTVYGSIEELIYSLISRWYYFFYLGGLISLLWRLINLIINREINVKSYSD